MMDHEYVSSKIRSCCSNWRPGEALLGFTYDTGVHKEMDDAFFDHAGLVTRRSLFDEMIRNNVKRRLTPER